MSTGEKIKQFRESQGLSVLAFARKYSLKSENLYKWEKGTVPSDPEDYKYLESIMENFPFLKEPDAVYKKGNPSVSSVETQKDANEYLNKRRDRKNSDFGPFMVPLVPIKAQAGYSKSYSNTDYINKLELFPIVPGIDYRGASWRYFEVEGDSMEDTFKEGQYLLASQVIQEDWQNIDNFYVYIVVTDEKVMVKRLAKVTGKDYWAAISDNEKKYPQFPIMVRDVKELWKYRRHIDWDASPPKKFEIKI